MSFCLRSLAIPLVWALALGARPPARAGADGPAQAPAMYDCNDNGVEDAVDIAIGSSSDADLDGIPDECQTRRVQKK